MSAIYRTDSPPGPVARWFVERLKLEAARRTKEKLVSIDDMSLRRLGVRHFEFRLNHAA
jgi:hypothetical protein